MYGYVLLYFVVIVFNFLIFSFLNNDIIFNSQFQSKIFFEVLRYKIKIEFQASNL